MMLICPVCGGALLIKNGKYGMFYGCSNFASRGCRFTRRWITGPGIRNDYDPGSISKRFRAFWPLVVRARICGPPATR